MLTRMDEPREACLVAQAKNGNQDAFNTLIAFYRPAVYEYAKNWLGDHDKAEDATQNALLFAWQHIKGCEYRPGRFVFWLLAISRNRNLEIARGYEGRQDQRIRARTKAEFEAGCDLGGLEGKHWAWKEKSVEFDLPDEESRVDLLVCLTSRQREVVELRADGLTIPAIAKRLQICVKTVKCHLEDAKIRIGQKDLDSSFYYGRGRIDRTSRGAGGRKRITEVGVSP